MSSGPVGPALHAPRPAGAVSAGQSTAQPSKMLQRCWGWDYKSPCIYQITLALADRGSEALGHLVIDSDGNGDPSRVESHVELTAAGRAVESEWRRIGELTPAIKPLELQIMPDHIHGILRVTERLSRPLGQIFAGFKTGSSKAAIGAGGFWSEGFQDTILFHEGQLENMFSYLRDNPRRLAVKRLYRRFFTVKRDLKIGLTPNKQNSSTTAPRPVGAASAAPLIAHFEAIGNEALLKAPHIFQVQCSRSYLAYKRVAKPGGGLKIARDDARRPIIERESPEFGEKLKTLLAMAEKGAVLISPCISDGEREIARRAMEANAKLITLTNKGFSPLFKPTGRAFDSASEGRLLMLAPATWSYTPGEKKMTRLDACALNRIAQLIAGDGAAEINYRGMRPANIDALVKEAVGAARPVGPASAARHAGPASAGPHSATTNRRAL